MTKRVPVGCRVDRDQTGDRCCGDRGKYGIDDWCSVARLRGVRGGQQQPTEQGDQEQRSGEIFGMGLSARRLARRQFARELHRPTTVGIRFVDQNGEVIAVSRIHWTA